MAEVQESHEKVVVITGASSGIGMSTALAFAEDGYNIVLAARRAAELEKVAKECQIRGALTKIVITDTTDDTAVHTLRNEAVATFGHIDIWINNAGVYMAGKFEDTPLVDIRRVMETNFFGYVHGSHAALEQFREQEYGTLINISSVNASAPQPYVGIYSASKAAVRALDEALRMELRLDALQDKIHISTVMPASIDTNLFQNAANYTGRELQALEPVYDPSYVAQQILKTAKHPKRELIVGPMGKLMAMQNAHSPRMYERQISKYTASNLLDTIAKVATDGNLFKPLNNSGERGGWRSERLRADHTNMLAAAAAITAIVSVGAITVIAAKKQKTPKKRGLSKILFG